MTEKSPASKAHTDAQGLSGQEGVEEVQAGAQGDSCPDGQSNVVKGQVEGRPNLVKSHSHVRNGSHRHARNGQGTKLEKNKNVIYDFVVQ